MASPYRRKIAGPLGAQDGDVHDLARIDPDQRPQDLPALPSVYQQHISEGSEFLPMSGHTHRRRLLSNVTATTS
jgi:hypothetical protein